MSERETNPTNDLREKADRAVAGLDAGGRLTEKRADRFVEFAVGLRTLRENGDVRIRCMYCGFVWREGRRLTRFARRWHRLTRRSRRFLR